MKAAFVTRKPAFWSLCLVMSALFPSDGRSQTTTIGDVVIESRDFSPDQPPEKRIAKCLACHGEHAGGDIDFGPETRFGTPALRGLQESYLNQTLVDYKAGRRANEEMSPIASMLDEETIDFMARTFAAFPVLPLKPEADRVRLVQNDPKFRVGRTIAWQGMPEADVPACVGCHGASRENDAALGPHLAGQNTLYMARQLKAFADKTRRTSHADLMRPVVAGLSTDEIDAVSYYYEQIVELQKP